MLKRRRRVKDIEDAVKVAATKSDDDFIREYLVRNSEGSSGTWNTSWKHPTTDAIHSLSLTRSLHTSADDLEACFHLVEKTSRADYAASSRGWHPKDKRREMREPDLRYLLVRDPAGRVCGFTSLMPTMEEGQPVVYCYEIHLEPDLRGTGLAGLLMGLLETVARNVEVMQKVMLTVFACNTRALAFYRRCGFEADGMSPQPRKLRGGVVKIPDYTIMSKRVDRPRAARGAAALDISPADETDQSNALDRPAKIAKLDSNATSPNGHASGEE